MPRVAALVVLPAVAACAPPPAVDVAADLVPSIEILYPENGQLLPLDEDCSLTEPIVVNVVGVDPGTVTVGTEGHDSNCNARSPGRFPPAGPGRQESLVGSPALRNARIAALT